MDLARYRSGVGGTVALLNIGSLLFIIALQHSNADVDIAICPSLSVRLSVTFGYSI